jgi:VCBS repeat protein
MVLLEGNPFGYAMALAVILAICPEAPSADCNGNGIDDARDIVPFVDFDLVSPNLLVGLSPYFVLTVDLDGDGREDLATANLGSSDVSVLINKGTGSSYSSSKYAVRTSPHSLIAADINDDHRLDLITVGGESFSGAGYLSLLLNRGNGSFFDDQSYPLGIYPYSAAVADLNGDGKLDIATANAGCSYCPTTLPGGISVLTNAGNKEFERMDYASSAFPYVIISADINKDGNIDLVAASCGNYNGPELVGAGTWVLFNNGDGTFQEAVKYEVPACSIAAVDLDGDDFLDLAISTSGGTDTSASGIWTLMGKGDGGFKPEHKYPIGAHPRSMAVADLNGDNSIDLVTANSSGDVSVILNKGSGVFEAPMNYNVGIDPRSVIAADLDGDAQVDLAAATYGESVPRDTSVAVLTNKENGQFNAAVRYSTSDGAGNAVAVVTADLNGDGNLDLVLGNDGSEQLPVLLNNSTAAFSVDLNKNGIPDECESSLSVPGDSNRDGRLDISDAITLLGFLFFGSPTVLPCGDGKRTHPANLSLIDWQPDGAIDAADAVAALSFLFVGTQPHALAIPGVASTGCVPISGCEDGCGK